MSSTSSHWANVWPRPLRLHLRRSGGPIIAAAPGAAQQPLAGVVVVERRGERLEGALLLVREVLRDLDLEPVVDITSALAGRARGPLASQPLDGAVLGAGGNADAL